MRIVTAILFALLTVTGASAAKKPADGRVPANKRVDITGVEIYSDGERAVVAFEATAGKKAAKGNRMITVTPVVISDSERFELTPIGVRGRRSYISQTRRARAAGTTIANEGMILLGKGETYAYTASLPESELAADSRLIFESEARVCCSDGEKEKLAASDFVGERTEIVMPDPGPAKTTGDRIAANYDFVEPLPDGEVRFTDKIRDNALVVFFELDSYELRKEYRENENILNQIIAAINILCRAGDSEIATVMLAGFASPEGSAERNRVLGEGRGLALREYITAYTPLRAGDFVMHNGGADWNGLRIMVEASDIPCRDQILDIIDNTPEWDASTNTGRMDSIKKLDGGRVYDRLRSDFFPELRNTAYIKVYYRNK